MAKIIRRAIPIGAIDEFITPPPVDEQLVFSWAPKLARKCESKHWFPCGADGRSGGRSSDYQIFSEG